MFPYSCDARLYYLPWATGVLIALNVFFFFAAATGAIDASDGWLLEYGNGVHPAQWVGSIFMHGGLEHLLTNMFFLWTFGLVVEGKLGWKRFVPIYLTIGVGESAIEQIAMSGSTSDGFSLGASAAIYGLMMMACVWAPANSLSVAYWFLTFMGTFEIQVGFFALLFIASDVASASLFGTGALSSVWHLLGGVIGFGIGFALFKSGAVDCEDWDLFSVIKGEYGADKKRKREAAQDAKASEPDQVAARASQQVAEAQRKFDAYLQINQPEQALAVRRRMIDRGTPLEVGRDQLVRLVMQLHKEKKWAISAPLMAEILDRFGDDSPAIRLKLAQICLMELERPQRALELLATWNGATLPEPHETLRRKIAATAKRRVAEGAVEVDDGAW